MNCASTNILLHGSLHTCQTTSTGQILRCKIAVSNGMCIYNFHRYCQIVLQTSNACFPTQCYTVLLMRNPHLLFIEMTWHIVIKASSTNFFYRKYVLRKTFNHLAHCTNCCHLKVKYFYILTVFYIQVEK